MPTPQSALDEARRKQEAERQALERFMASLNSRLDGMRTSSPAEAERSHQWLKDQCTDKRLPMEFKRKTMDRAKALECQANMRATDKALEEAVALAHAERMQERAMKLALARQYFSKACSLGADEKFRKATQRLIDTAMMTGGIYKPGMATRAKPLDTAPRNPNQAKVPAKV